MPSVVWLGRSSLTFVRGLVDSVWEGLRQKVVDIDEAGAARYALHGHAAYVVRFHDELRLVIGIVVVGHTYVSQLLMVERLTISMRF